MKSLHPQSGIAIAPILFIVALLAILATAIAAGSSTFSSGSEQEKARVYATAIIDWSIQVRNAIQRVMALGCSDTQISFENPVRAGYTNPNAPTDKHCHIFDVAGGGLVWTEPPVGSVPNPYNDAPYGDLAGPGTWSFSPVGGLYLQLGRSYLSSVQNLAMYLPLPNQALCLAINKLLNMPTNLSENAS